MHVLCSWFCFSVHVFTVSFEGRVMVCHPLNLLCLTNWLLWLWSSLMIPSIFFFLQELPSEHDLCQNPSLISQKNSMHAPHGWKFLKTVIRPTSPIISSNTCTMVNLIIDSGKIQNFYPSCSMRHSSWRVDEWIFPALKLKLNFSLEI